MLPPELREPPREVAPAVEQRVTAADRRFTDRRIRDDGSPYGVERRSGAETRVGERRGAADPPPRLVRSGVRGAHAHDFDYVPHLPDLLARFHGR
ncbi:MAG: hypothetical protein AB7U83_17150 [Vicinamibacterales bacterium]